MRGLGHPHAVFDLVEGWTPAHRRPARPSGRRGAACSLSPSLCPERNHIFNHDINVKPTHLCHCYIQLEDTGRYSCLANSPAGDDDKEFLVRVHGEYHKKVM